MQLIFVSSAQVLRMIKKHSMQEHRTAYTNLCVMVMVLKLCLGVALFLRQ